MRHEIQPEEMMAYLDGEIAADRAAAAADHLSRCRDCQAVAADLQVVSRRLTDWQVEGLAPEVGRMLEQQPIPTPAAPRPRLSWRRVMPWAVGFAAVCVILVVSFEEGLHRSARWAEQVVSVNGRPLPAAAVPLPPVPQRRGQQAQVIDGRPEDLVTTRNPIIVRTAQIALTTNDFAKTRTAVEEILSRRGGHVGSMNIQTPAGAGRTLQARLRVPTSQLDGFLAEARKLGHVDSESQNGEEVTQQFEDLEARLANARTTEQRMSEILRQRTGKITDVLEVENQIARVRGEIERMQAEQKHLGDRVSFATLDVHVTEEYHAELGAGRPAVRGRLRNAAVEGYRNLADGAIGLTMLVLAYGPSTILWGALLFFPAVLIWRARKNRRL